MPTKRKAVKMERTYHDCKQSGGFLMTIYLNRENAILAATKILSMIGWESDTKGVIIKPRSDGSLTVQKWN